MRTEKLDLLGFRIIPFLEVREPGEVCLISCPFIIQQRLGIQKLALSFTLMSKRCPAYLKVGFNNQAVLVPNKAPPTTSLG